MKRFSLICLIFLFLCSCSKEVCQECTIIKESNQEAVRGTLQKIGGGFIYRLDQGPYLEIENHSFISCDIDEMNRTEALDNLLETQTFEEDHVSIQYQVRWFSNCRLVD